MVPSHFRSSRQQQTEAWDFGRPSNVRRLRGGRPLWMRILTWGGMLSAVVTMALVWVIEPSIGNRFTSRGIERAGAEQAPKQAPLKIAEDDAPRLPPVQSPATVISLDALPDVEVTAAPVRLVPRPTRAESESAPLPAPSPYRPAVHTQPGPLDAQPAPMNSPLTAPPNPYET